ncbi:hypothetical protein [Humibacter sp.]|jgi:hypothetical protein|uniref:hypothetical protein n=1 Tax=Humibacter sp. TaxID=1940291 RepID=UPI002C9A506F|nr:hypothetical protein [Humibacter sp.]HVX08907.1 hypothetical protein [Humibacter sp.]
MLENFQPQPGSQIVVVNNTPFTLAQPADGEPWSISRGGTVLGYLYRNDAGAWAVWPLYDGCTYIPSAITPGEALRQAL